MQLAAEVEPSTAARHDRPKRALEFKDITVRFGDYTAVKQATISVADGEFVSIVGPTGCGKSTLLNIAAGLLETTEGEILVFGEPLFGLNTDAGYLFQMDALMPWRTALANVVAGLEYRKVPKESARKLGLEFVNWRCLRTSHATWLKMAEADVKDAQAQMRHSRASTTLDIYQQFVPESQKRAVGKLSSLSKMVH